MIIFTNLKTNTAVECGLKSYYRDKLTFGSKKLGINMIIDFISALNLLEQTIIKQLPLASFYRQSHFQRLDLSNALNESGINCLESLLKKRDIYLSRFNLHAKFYLI